MNDLTRWECLRCARVVDATADDCCPACGEPLLPELTDEEKATADRLCGPEFIDRVLRGERPITDPTTFAN